MLVLKHVPPKELLLSNRTSATVLHALGRLGKDAVDAPVVGEIRELLSPRQLLRDAPYTTDRSKDAKVRESGAVAFQFFKLKVAPPELVTALGDADAGVRSWASLVLGEIADPKTVPVLTALAGDPKQDARLRCNVIHSLGRMKAAAATELMRKLLADENQAVQAQAAIALCRVTGAKAKQIPAGYNAD
jgi:HEAT repeat protein